MDDPPSGSVRTMTAGLSGGAPATVLGLGAWARAGIAAAVAALLWLAVGWSLDWW